MNDTTAPLVPCGTTVRIPGVDQTGQVVRRITSRSPYNPGIWCEVFWADGFASWHPETELATA